jgi:hypothetical protein
MKSKSIFLLALLAFSFTAVAAQAKYNYAGQKQFIPIELGKVYLGMPFADFARQIALKECDIDNRFEWLECKEPFVKGGVESIVFKVHGLGEDEIAGMLRKVTRPGKMENGDEYEEEVQMLDAAKIPAKNKGIVYQINLQYKKGFDLKKQALKMFGTAKDVHKPGDQFHIYDMQWTKKTTDGLTLLIRFYEETNALMLAGIIDKTEWDPTA